MNLNLLFVVFNKSSTIFPFRFTDTECMFDYKKQMLFSFSQKKFLKKLNYIPLKDTEDKYVMMSIKPFQKRNFVEKFRNFFNYLKFFL